MSQFCLNVCTRIKTGSTDGRKQVAGDDVTIKRSTLANSFNSFKHRNVKHVIKVSSTYIMSALDPLDTKFKKIKYLKCI